MLPETGKVTQAAIFAREYARNTAQEMLLAIKRNARDAGIVTKIALFVSMPHQIGFMLSKMPLDFPKIVGMKEVIAWLESTTMISGAVGIPVAVDFLILICIRQIAAKAATTTSKVVAFLVMLAPVAVSGIVNYGAHGDRSVKLFFVVPVALIPLAEGVRAFMKPSFKKIDRIETMVADEVAQLASVPVLKKKSADKRGDKRERVSSILNRNPDLTAGELAAAAGVSLSYAAKLLKELRDELVTA